MDLRTIKDGPKLLTRIPELQTRNSELRTRTALHCTATDY